MDPELIKFIFKADFDVDLPEANGRVMVVVAVPMVAELNMDSGPSNKRDLELLDYWREEGGGGWRVGVVFYCHCDKIIAFVFNRGRKTVFSCT